MATTTVDIETLSQRMRQMIISIAEGGEYAPNGAYSHWRQTVGALERRGLAVKNEHVGWCLTEEGIQAYEALKAAGYEGASSKEEVDIAQFIPGAEQKALAKEGLYVLGPARVGEALYTESGPGARVFIDTDERVYDVRLGRWKKGRLEIGRVLTIDNSHELVDVLAKHFEPAAPGEKEALDALCRRCHGTGRLPQFAHYKDGVCFRCEGSGVEPDAESS